MPSKQTGNIDQPPGARAAFPSMPILHVAVHTILSQSSGLWEHLPKLIGFAGRLGFFWGPHGREGRPRGGGAVFLLWLECCRVVQRVIVVSRLSCARGRKCVCALLCSVPDAASPTTRDPSVSHSFPHARSAWCL